MIRFNQQKYYLFIVPLVVFRYTLSIKGKEGIKRTVITIWALLDDLDLCVT